MIRFLKFSIVGGVNTLISLWIFYILNKLLGLNPLVSSAIGYICGMLNSYILNKKWTFKDTNSKPLLQLIKFSLVNAISLGINLLAMYVLVHNFNIDSMISQVFATGFSTISNYIGSKIFVFHYPKESII
ncbi:GtrA family protein [Clostridium malenominatum]|uniref:GtrA family protein n=1 Tax=Clostridium malenominatum TaxID=1539 RepID=A0ABN1J3I6_9CLOT